VTGMSSSDKELIADSASQTTQSTSVHPNRDIRLLLTAPLALYIVSVLLVQILGSIIGPPSESFPVHCDEASRNCTRLADQPHRGDGSRGVLIYADSTEVREEFLSWVEETPRTEVSTDWISVMHVVVHTKWMRYPDDLFVRITCEGDLTRLEIHSESRLGSGDLGVNDDRALALASHLRGHEWSTDGVGCILLHTS